MKIAKPQNSYINFQNPKKMSDSSRITKLLERLIISIIPSTSNNSLQEYYKYIHRIITSRISNLDHDEATLKTLITQKVFSIAAENNTQKHTANTTMLRVQELLQKIFRVRLMTYKNSILYILYKLANTGKNGKVTNSGPIEALFKAREDIKRPLNNTSSMEIEKPLLSNDRRLVNESFQVQTIKKLSNKGNESINLSENDIIRDLLFVFHAIDGHYINFNDQDNAYSIKSGIPLTEPLRTLINTLCEIGFLYKQLNNFLTKPQPGLLRQAFGLSIKEELNEYFKLLALLENLRLESDESGSQSLSLRKLALWIIEPFERLKWLNIMSEGVVELIGGDVLSSIYSYRTHGSPAILQLINRILVNINQPFLKYIHLWIYQGVINDSIGEFFVSENDNESNIWLNKYKLITNKVPSFLEQELAKKIFLSGKTVNFLKKCCNIKEWTLNIEPYDSKELYHSKFRDWIFMCSNIINQKLLEVLFLNFHLEKHLDFLKRYLLMGQGDLIQNLMDNLTTELNKPASQIYRHQLMGYLETAIRTSNTQYHSSEFVNRLEIKLLEASPGDTGWDIFSLDYRVDSPLNTIFHNDIMRKYLRIFNFLWRVKRVEFCLNAVWINQVKASKYLAGIPGVKKEFHRCHLLRNEMIHFIDNLFNYLMVEVIESTWDQFKEKFSQLKDMDELIEMHDSCIDRILEKALLKEKTEAIYKHLLKIFELIYRLKFTQEILLNKAYEEYSLIQQRKKQREIEELVGEEQRSLNRGEVFTSGFSGESFKIVDTIANDYMEALFNFQNLLRKEENIGNLKFLSFKLDFNEYYNNKPNNKFSNMSNDYFQGKNFMGASGNALDYQKKQKTSNENSQNEQIIQTTTFFQNSQAQNKTNFLESALNVSKANFNEKSQNISKIQILPTFTQKIEKNTILQKNTMVSEENSKKTWIEEKETTNKAEIKEKNIIEPIFRHDMEEEEDEFLQEGEDEEEEEYSYEEGNEFDPDKTNSFRKK